MALGHEFANLWSKAVSDCGAEGRTERGKLLEREAEVVPERLCCRGEE
jgi:hypothetical protein